MIPELLAALLLIAPAPDQTKLSAKPGGKMSIDYSAPTWREGMESQLKPGQPWRLGANDPTTWTTAAGIVFEDAVLFPGAYHLAAVPKGGDAWELVFHHDGSFFSGKTEEARAKLTEVGVGKKDVAKRLVIELRPDKKAGKNAYEFEATFGPRRMVGRFEAPKAKSTKAKAGRTGLELTWLLRSDLEDLAKALERSPTPIASLDVKDREQPLRLHLRGGDAPVLQLVEAGGEVGRVEGQRGDVEKPADEVEVEVESGDEACALTIRVGAHSYHFELAEKTLAP